MEDNRKRLTKALERLGQILLRVEPTIIVLDLEETKTLIAIGVRNTVSAADGKVPDVIDEDVEFFEHLLRRYEDAIAQMPAH